MISYLSKSVKSAKFEIILTEANSSFVAANIFNFFNFHSKPSKEISMMQYQRYFLQAKIILWNVRGCVINKPSLKSFS